jgi:general secretion pathway protein D
MKMSKFTPILATALLCIAPLLQAETIAEKKMNLSKGGKGLTPDLEAMLESVNKEIAEEQSALKELYCQAQILWKNGSSNSCYATFIKEIQEKKEALNELKESWRHAYKKSKVGKEQYALWQQTDATLEQLIIDYGASDFVYLIPKEVAEIRVSLSSHILIPRSSWQEMLEAVLAQNGVGIRVLNPFLKELYRTEDDSSSIELITNNMQELNLYEGDVRICFMMSPEPQELKKTWFFLKKFSNDRTTHMELIGRHILVLGTVNQIKELLKIHSFVSKNSGTLEYKAVPLFKTQPQEVAAALETIFGEMVESFECQGIEDPCTQSGLRVVVLSDLAQSLFLIGTKQEICKAEEIIQRIEAQVGMARDRVVYQYRTKHSDPEELAQILERVYLMMLQTNLIYLEGNSEINTNGESSSEADAVSASVTKNIIVQNAPRQRLDNSQVYRENFYQQGGFIINPRPSEPGAPFRKETNTDRTNFIIDAKTGSIVMVVEAEILPKLKELIRRLDVPKMMVQIEVMLFEKRIKRENSYGLNLLKIGGCASQERLSCISWNEIGKQIFNKGVLQFFFSRPKSEDHPAFDAAYRFLLSQDDVYINATPSVTTVNQTPATIAISDEISISTGVFEVPNDGTNALKEAFTRAQYGITIQVTPTIHIHDDEELFADPTDYVTLNADITFDTILPNYAHNSRPDVNRRHLVNEVRIADGQSIIMGGLRRKNSSDGKDAIPFLGELPGIGKLFSTNHLKDDNSEMFILMTPKIIRDPLEDYRRIRCMELSKRPGDIPAFMCCMDRALECEKNRFLHGTFTMLFGNEPNRCIEDYE